VKVSISSCASFQSFPAHALSIPSSFQNNSFHSNIFDNITIADDNIISVSPKHIGGLAAHAYMFAGNTGMAGKDVHTSAKNIDSSAGHAHVCGKHAHISGKNTRVSPENMSISGWNTLKTPENASFQNNHYFLTIKN